MPSANQAIQARERLIGVLIFPIAFFIFLSLLTYSANDYPNSSVQPFETLNSGGRTGARMAYILMLALGYSAFIIPVTLSVFGWRLIRNRSLKSFPALAGLGAGLLFSGGVVIGMISNIPENRRFEISGLAAVWLGKQITGLFGKPFDLVAGAFIFTALLVAAVVLLTRARRRRHTTSPRFDDMYDTPPLSRSSMSP
jgi:hypothetical protein